MKRFLSMIIAMSVMMTSLFALTVTSYAATKKATVNGVVYYYTVKDKAVTITETCVKKAVKILNVPSKLGGNAVKTLATNATIGAMPETVVIPNSVTTLENASVGMSLTKTVKIGTGLKTINGDAFERCTRLESITVNSKNKNFTVYKGVLYNKSKTALVKYPVAKIPASCTVLKSVKTIRAKALAGSSKLKTVNLGKNVKTIKASAFYCSLSINKFTVDKSNKYFSVKDGVLFNKKKTVIVFYPCAKSGTTYSVPKGVTKVSANAFADASKLTEVKLPATLITISTKSFQNAYRLKTATLPAKLKTIGAYAFEGTVITRVVAPKTLESLGSGAYRFCYKLKSVDLSKSILTKINSCTFQEDKSITQIKLPNTLKTIGTNAFQYASVTELDFPESVTKLSDKAFSGCKKLTSVIVRGTETDISLGMPRTEYTAYVDEYDDEGYTAYKYNFKITAPADSKAAQFAADNGIEFIELE